MRRIDFSRVCSSITCATRSGARSIRLAANSLIAPHQFEKAKRVAHGMDLVDLVGVNSRDWHWFDPVAFTASDDERFRLVLESVPATKKKPRNFQRQTNALTPELEIPKSSNPPPAKTLSANQLRYRLRSALKERRLLNSDSLLIPYP
jgi:hypothetical protein